MMKRLKQISYFEPTTLKEAMEILAEKGSDAYPLAGGTDLLVRMKRGDISPSVLVNLKRIEKLDQIAGENGDGLRIGALASISGIEHSAVIQSGHPVLSQAAGSLGSPSIRNLATLGGNIGRASPASDMAPALLVLGARVLTAGPSGEKEMDLDTLFAGPGSTTLAPGQVITAFLLPKAMPHTGAAYLKLGRRVGSGDCALVGVAGLITTDEKGEGAVDVKIALASVGPVPKRAKKAEQLVLSGPLTEERFREAGRIAAEETTPITDMRCSASYRKEMVAVLTYRALSKALKHAQGGQTN